MPVALTFTGNIDPTVLATFLLALVTVALAWKTRALAQSGQKTAGAAERELELIRNQTDAATRQSWGRS